MSHLSPIQRGRTVSCVLSCLILIGSASTSQARLVYSWSFGNPGSIGPIEGTLTFESVNSGEGGRNLTPDSITITSAPGHTFADGYELGMEVIDSITLAGHASMPATTAWTIDSEDELGFGTAQFQSSFGIPHDLFRLTTALGSCQLTTWRLTASEWTTVGDATFTVIAEATADFDQDGDKDGFDFLTWQRGFGTDVGSGNVAPRANGNANGDQFIDGADLDVWEEQYGTGGAPLSSVAIAPEPTSLLLLTTASFLCCLRRPRA